MGDTGGSYSLRFNFRMRMINFIQTQPRWSSEIQEGNWQFRMVKPPPCGITAAPDTDHTRHQQFGSDSVNKRDGVRLNRTRSRSKWLSVVEFERRGIRSFLAEHAIEDHEKTSHLPDAANNLPRSRLKTFAQQTRQCSSNISRRPQLSRGTTTTTTVRHVVRNERGSGEE